VIQAHQFPHWISLGENDRVRLDFSTHTYAGSVRPLTVTCTITPLPPPGLSEQSIEYDFTRPHSPTVPQSR